MSVEPKSCPRPRVTRYGVFYPKKYTEWRSRAKLLVPFSEPPSNLAVIFVFKRPKRLKKGNRVAHTKRPDIDNCIKSLFDLFDFDDAKIHTFCASKVYGTHEETPHIEITWTD